MENIDNTDNTNITIGQLEEALLKAFPAHTACEWDSTGLLVGDSDEVVSRVAVALDPTVTAVHQAAEAGCNVLLTHHPTFCKNTIFTKFEPADSVALADGAVVFAAAEMGVALMNFHTALDVSVEAGLVLPTKIGLLDLTDETALEPVVLTSVDIHNYLTEQSIKPEAQLGFGRISNICSEIKLSDLAQKCLDTFGRKPRVWGDPNRHVSRIATTTGSTGSARDPQDLLPTCVRKGVEVLICGEVKYHDALDISEAGLSLIELGHDVSELPLVEVLAKHTSEAGVPEQNIVHLDQSHNWE